MVGVTLKAEGVQVTEFCEQIPVDVVVDSGGRACSATLNRNIGRPTSEDVIHRGKG